ncbi:MAG: ATP-binding cassette domain-containing protein [Actinomycetota bacterium]|nr:ATP-binding cassette domain-containing protein [Actinomycetota bacterium]
MRREIGAEKRDMLWRPPRYYAMLGAMGAEVATYQLSRSFGERQVVCGLDLEVAEGEVFGLLGPNGAGKTTTIRMLITLLAPTSGTASIAGFDITKQPAEVRRRIGYASQNVPWQVNSQLTGREKLEIEAALYHVPRRECRRRAAEVLELVDLTEHADRQISHYSGGMQKRLDLASGLLHRPDVLILDEPSLGLDVQSRHRIWDHLESLGDEKVTVLLATNYLDEADRLCDRITIIDRGNAVVTGAPSDLKRQVAADVIQVATSRSDDLQEAIGAQPWVQRIMRTETGDVHIYVDDASVAMPALMRLSMDQGVDFERVTYTQPTLDDVFLLHTGRELRELQTSA